MRLPVKYSGGALIVVLMTSVVAFGQTTATPSPTTSDTPVATQTPKQAAVAVFRQQQMALASSEKALLGSNPTPAQIAAWESAHASQLAAQKLRMQAAAVASASVVQPENRQFRVPPNASPTLAAFMASQAALANARAHLHNQLVQQAQASGNFGFAQLQVLSAQEDKLFQEQNASLLALQTQRAQTLANEAAQKIEPMPPMAAIPATANAQQAAYLTMRSNINRSLVQLHNQYASATPAVRAAAYRAWSQEHAAQMKQAQQQATTLSVPDQTASAPIEPTQQTPAGETNL